VHELIHFLAPELFILLRKVFISPMAKSDDPRGPIPPAQLANDPNPHIFIFVNPTSGGNAAAAILQTGSHHFTFTEPGLQSNIAVYNIREGEHGNKPGFRDLKDQIDKHEAGGTPFHVLIAGGDGTVMWAISEAQAHAVDMTKIAFGVIPYGTGNDFSRALGWGGSSPGKNIMDNGMKFFKRMVADYLQAEVIDFDIWNVSVKVCEDGGAIKQVKDGQKVVMKIGDIDRKILTKPMCNYFSMLSLSFSFVRFIGIGIESRLGLGFDKKRTTSTFRNKLRYAIEGLKKSMTKTPRINDIIDGCNIEDPEGPRTLFRTGLVEDGVPKLLGNPISLIFLNINSFAAGCDLWPGASKSGVSTVPKIDKTQIQSLGDGKLEILTYQRLFALSMEQTKNNIFGGNGNRISQERGPMTVNFRKDISEKRTYLQIDGEFFTLDKCESATVSHNMTVKVLKRSSQK